MEMVRTWLKFLKLILMAQSCFYFELHLVGGIMAGFMASKCSSLS